MRATRIELQSKGFGYLFGYFVGHLTTAPKRRECWNDRPADPLVLVFGWSVWLECSLGIICDRPPIEDDRPQGSHNGTNSSPDCD